MKTPALFCTLAAVAALTAPVAAQAASSLVGTSSLRVQQKVEYRATGLAPAGRYSLRIRRRVEHDGRTYRCAAYLSAPRLASGTERFLGSVPTGLLCLPASGDGAQWLPRTSKGTYEAVVCVVAARNLCDARDSVAGKTVRVR